jgi:TatD DNase family protein
MLIDTHCHIHDVNYPLDRDSVIERAFSAGVKQMICIGTSVPDSADAINFAASRGGVFASIGVHPHDTKDGWSGIANLIDANNPKIVAIGEIGLDYHYDFSPCDIQKQALRDQIELALDHDLPIIFHVREAFDDFWPIFDEYHSDDHPIRGVLHSFTDTPENAMEGIKRGLYIGISGFSTFTKNDSQKAMFASLPLDRILLETDAPYLTPVPFRGKVNEPAFVSVIAESQGFIRQIDLEKIIIATTANARVLFNL